MLQRVKLSSKNTLHNWKKTIISSAEIFLLLAVKKLTKGKKYLLSLFYSVNFCSYKKPKNCIFHQLLYFFNVILPDWKANLVPIWRDWKLHRSNVFPGLKFRHGSGVRQTIVRRSFADFFWQVFFLIWAVLIEYL